MRIHYRQKSPKKLPPTIEPMLKNLIETAGHMAASMDNFRVQERAFKVTLESIRETLRKAGFEA